MEELKQEIDKQKHVCHDVEDENESLRDENRHIREKMEELRDDIEQMERRHKEVMNEFDFECERLQNRVKEAELLAKEKERELKEYQTENKNYIEDFKHQTETEKRILETKLSQLETKIQETITTTYESSSTSQSTIKDYEQQIEFLNSVIVDMQKKNDDFKSRIQILEEIGMTEFEFSPATLQRTRSRDSPTTGRHQTITNGHIRATRLFCDICDVWDQHDTEDCPQQAMSFEETTTHSHYSASRRLERPFCDICEVFGHRTLECPQTDNTY